MKLGVTVYVKSIKVMDRHVPFFRYQQIFLIVPAHVHVGVQSALSLG